MKINDVFFWSQIFAIWWKFSIKFEILSLNEKCVFQKRFATFLKFTI
jgi:hypothetical protein